MPPLLYISAISKSHKNSEITSITKYYFYALNSAAVMYIALNSAAVMYIALNSAAVIYVALNSAAVMSIRSVA